MNSASDGFSKPAANKTLFPLMRFRDTPFSFYQKHIVFFHEKTHRACTVSIPESSIQFVHASVFIGLESSNISAQSSYFTDGIANTELANSEAMPTSEHCFNEFKK